MDEKVISYDLTKKFNEDNKKYSEIDSNLKDELKKKYFEYIGVDENLRDKNYDVNLVDVGDYGAITDENHIRANLIGAGWSWGLIAVATIIIYAIVVLSGLSGLFLGIIIALLIIGMLILILREIIVYYDLIKSSRDMKFKLITSVHILPIVIAFLYAFINYGIGGVISGLFAIVIIIIFAIILVGLGAFILWIIK